MRPAKPPLRPQRGAALLLGLLLLALFTLLVTHAWSDNQWHLRIGSHELSQARAESAARSALIWAERWLLRRPGDAPPTACAGTCAGAPVLAAGSLPDRPDTLDETWWLEHAQADGFDPRSGTLAADRSLSGTPIARWVIEELHRELHPGAEGGPFEIVYYRIVARAARAPRGAPVVIDSVLARPWGDPAWSDGVGATGVGADEVASGGGEAGALVAPPSFCRDASAPPHCGRLSWRRLR